MLNIFDKFPKNFGRFVKYENLIIISERSDIMTLGQNILDARKKSGLSQEQLGEKVDVTRQTISNWELDETSPNPEQLKLLSKALNISVDDLIGNDIQNVVLSKVKLTEKQTKSIKKILKGILTGFVVLLIIDVIALIVCFTNKLGPFKESKNSSNSNITYKIEG